MTITDAQERARAPFGQGLDRVFEENGLDTIVAPTAAPAPMTDLVNGDHRLLGSSSLCAVTGYPIISLPAGWVARLPVGLSFMGRAWSEPELIALAASFEHTHP